MWSWWTTWDYQQKHWKHWYRVQEVGGDKTRGGLMTWKRNYCKEEVIFDRQQSVSKTRSSWRNRSMQLHRRQVKTDKKKGENTNVYLYFVLNICKLCNVSNYSSLAVTPTETLVCHRNAKRAINNNDTNTNDNVYGAVIATQSLREFTRFIWRTQTSARWPPTFRPGQPTWAASPPVGCYMAYIHHRHLSITQLESWYSFYHPTEGGRLSQPRHTACSPIWCDYIVLHCTWVWEIRIMSWSLLVMLIQSNVCCCACYTGEYCFEVKAEPNSDDVTEHPHDKPRPYVFSF